MQYKAVAFDLDGTLLNSQGKILEPSKQAIQCCIEKGIKVILVTGRHHTATYPYHHELGLDTPMICCNGTYLYDPKNDQVLTSNPLSKEQTLTLIELAKQYQLHLLIYSRDKMNFELINPHMEKFAQWANSYPEPLRPKLNHLTSFNQLIENNETIWKAVISHPDKALMQQALDQLSPQQFSCEWSWIDRADIANIGNTKGARLLELLKMWNIDPQQVIAFGDNHNDTSMLTAVGLGVAMGNAEPEVQQQAKLVTLSNNEDGIAQVLNEVILK